MHVPVLEYIHDIHDLIIIILIIIIIRPVVSGVWSQASAETTFVGQYLHSQVEVIRCLCFNCQLLGNNTRSVVQHPPPAFGPAAPPPSSFC